MGQLSNGVNRTRSGQQIGRLTDESKDPMIGKGVNRSEGWLDRRSLREPRVRVMGWRTNLLGSKWRHLEWLFKPFFRFFSVSFFFCFSLLRERERLWPLSRNSDDCSCRVSSCAAVLRRSFRFDLRLFESSWSLLFENLLGFPRNKPKSLYLGFWFLDFLILFGFCLYVSPVSGSLVVSGGFWFVVGICICLSPFFFQYL